VSNGTTPPERDAVLDRPMPTVLISLCNIKRTGTQFALIAADLSRRKFGLVDCSTWIGPGDTGITGLLATERAIYACVQAGETSRIAVLGRDLKQTAVIADARFRDLHSIKQIGERICVISTGNSKVFSFTEDDLTVRILWEYEREDGVLHVNDIGERDGRLFLMSHVHPGFDGEGRPGAIWYIDSREVLLGALRHPHTIHQVGDTLHCLSSGAGQLVTLDWASGTRSALRLGGYVRGMTTTDAGFVVARSSIRMYSRKQGPTVNPVDLSTVIGNPRFMSFLVETEGPRLVRNHNLTHLGLEFYDVIKADIDFPAVAERYSIQLRSQALYQRIAELERLLTGQHGGASEDGEEPGVGPDEAV
jgi:hypothetical protein